MMFLTILLFLVLTATQALGATQEQIDQATTVIERLCLSGNNYQLKASVGGSVRFLQIAPGAKGGIDVDVKNSKGGVNYLNEQIRLQFDKHTRDCMQPHIDKLIKIILGEPDVPPKKSLSDRKIVPQPQKQSKASASSPVKSPNVSIFGALPIHLWEKFPGLEGPARSGGTTKSTFTNSQLGFIIKIQNNTNSPIRVNVAVLDGCVAVPFDIARKMLIKGETLPELWIFDEAYAELHKTTIQRARVSGTIRPDSRDIPASGIGYIGVLFPLPGGKGGALFAVPETVSTKGKCDAIKKWTSQPAVYQLFEEGPVRFMFPDIAPELRDGRIKIRLHMGNEVLEVNPKDLGKLYSVRAQDWSSLLFPEMYEVPDDDFPPVEGLLKPRN